jgi:hypothetical protein
MKSMPRPRPPHLNRELTRHGKPVWYVRRNGKRIRLRSDFGTPEFEAEYQAALNGTPQSSKKGEPAVGTLAWLIECFRGTAAWQARSASTRAKWDGLYRQVIESAGNISLSAITPKAIRAGLERRAHTPGQAQHFLNVMRALFRWAIKAQLVKTDPTAGIEAPARDDWDATAGIVLASKPHGIAAPEPRIKQHVQPADAMLVSALGQRTTSPPTKSDGCGHSKAWLTLRRGG